jgi:uncharacterized protein YdiU (UPF0061 family)
MLGEGYIAAERLNADPALAAWHTRWQARLSSHAEPVSEAIARMRNHNPVIIPRNHQVEAALAAATGPAGDLIPMEHLLDALSQPYQLRPGFERYAEPAPDAGRGYQTFCGT